MQRSLLILFISVTASCTSSSFDEEKARQNIDQLLDRWHQAAAEADGDRFFGSMTEEGIYIGTDPGERWTRKEFEEWAAPHFEGEKAWAFEAKERHIIFAEGGRTAWFDESLKTWMGPCRGSGVLTKEKEGWRIAHYHLAKSIPNPKMDSVLEVLSEK